MDETTSSSEGIGAWITDNPGFAVGAVVLILFGGYMLYQKLKKGSSIPSASSAQGTSTTTSNSGLTTDASGNTVAYVPAQTLFTTNNTITSSNVNSPNSSTATTAVSAPKATTITANPTIVAPTSIVTITHPTTPPTPMPVATPIVPKPAPSIPTTPPRVGTPAPTVAHKGALVWDQHYTIKSGDALSRIASTLTNSLRQQGMPTSLSVTYNDLYGHNMDVINKYAQQHGTPIKNASFPTPASINNIFPGEIITVPRWNKTAN